MFLTSAVHLMLLAEFLVTMFPAQRICSTFIFLLTSHYLINIEVVIINYAVSLPSNQVFYKLNVKH